MRIPAVCDGADAVHLGEPGGLQPVGKRRAPDAGRGARRRRGRPGGRCSARSWCYPQSNGTVELRERIAAMYPGATADHVEVTNGGSEANFVTMWHLIEPGDEVVSMVPNYGQTLGLAEGVRRHAAALAAAPLGGRHAAGTSISTACAALVDRQDAPHHHLQPEQPDRARASRAADLDGDLRRLPARVGAWVLSDEIYRGAELDGVETPSVWGRYERVIVTSGLSKAYGLPGLRIGWIVSSPRAGRHDLGVPRLHDHRPGHAQRPPGAHRAAAGDAREDPRAHAAHPADEPAGHHRLARRARRAFQLRACPTPAPSSTCGITTRSTPPMLVEPPARREERADRAGRSLRHGRLPADRLRQRDPATCATASTGWRTCCAACRPPRTRRRPWSTSICSSSGSATSASGSRGCSQEKSVRAARRLRPELARGRHRDAPPRHRRSTRAASTW